MHQYAYACTSGKQRGNRASIARSGMQISLFKNVVERHLVLEASWPAALSASK